MENSEDQASSEKSVMTVEEARKVLWIRPERRPIGEMLDEGLIDRDRLEWASKRAYDLSLRQAAKVLLEASEKGLFEKISPPTQQSNPAIPLKITLEQARVTRWPFRQYQNQPMGPLVDSGQLSLKDLGFAIETSYSAVVRQAATALLLHRLEQKLENEKSSGIVKVVSRGRSFSERRQLFLTLLQGAILGGSLGLFMGLLIGDLLNRSSRTGTISQSSEPLNLPGLVIAIIILVAGLGFAYLFNKLISVLDRQLEKRIEFYRKGQEAEDRVINIIHHALDANWWLFRNVELPNHKKQDVDIVLVGPAGVFALEIKNYSGEYRNIGSQWEYFTHNRWMKAKSNPTAQSQQNAARLSDYLKAEGIKQWVTPVVVWAGTEARITLKEPTAAVWTLEHQRDELGNLWQERTIPEPAQKQVVEKLLSLFQKHEKDVPTNQ